MRIAAAILVVALLSAAALGGGWFNAQAQRRALQGFRPVVGVVLQSDVRWVQADRCTLAVEYEYEVGGTVLRGTRLAPLELSGTSAWARRLAALYRTRSAVTVYCNPDRPAEAFLHPEASFAPYLWLLGPAPAWLALLWGLARGGFFRARPTALLVGPMDWYRLHRGGGPLTRLGWMSAGVAAWFCYLALLGAHWWTLPGRLDPWMPGFALAACGLLGLAPLVHVLRRLPTTLRLPEIQVHATLGRFQLRRPVIVRLTQSFRRRMSVRRVRLSLCCRRHSGLGSRRLFAERVVLAVDREFQPGQTLIEERRFEASPAEMPAASAFSRWRYPRIDWEIEVEIEPARGPAVCTRFPVDVLPGEAAAYAPAEAA